MISRVLSLTVLEPQDLVVLVAVAFQAPRLSLCTTIASTFAHDFRFDRPNSGGQPDDEFRSSWHTVRLDHTTVRPYDSINDRQA